MEAKSEVTFKAGEEQIYIGSYYTYDYGVSRGWIKYNADTIALAGESISDGYVQVKTMFDIKSRLFMEGSREDLLEYYNCQFGDEEPEEKENVSFQKRMLIKKVEDKKNLAIN